MLVMNRSTELTMLAPHCWRGSLVSADMVASCPKERDESVMSGKSLKCLRFAPVECYCGRET
jgi:hypothetical protein